MMKYNWICWEGKNGKKKNGILTKREKERERENYRVYTTINNRSTLQMEKVNEKLDCLCAFSYEIT